MVEAGRFDEAKATVSRLLREFPDSGRTAEAERMRRGLEAGYRTLADIYGH